MTDQQTKVISDVQARAFLSPLVQSKYHRTALSQNIIYPNEASTVASNPTAVPQRLRFIMPNVGMLATAQTYLTWRQRYDVGNVAAGEYIYQKDCCLWRSSDNTVLVKLPLSSNGWLRSCQVQKQNINANSLNYIQENLFRDNLRYTTVDGAYANSFSDTLYFNTDQRILYKNTTVSDQTGIKIWLNPIVPISSLSPLFATYSWIPCGLWSTHVTLDVIPYGDALTNFAAYSDFELRISYYNNPTLLAELKAGGSQYATFNDYFIQQQPDTTFAAAQSYTIQQEWASCDTIEVQCIGSRTNEAYYLGYCNATNAIDPSAADLPTIGIGKFDFTHNNTSLYAAKFDTLNELYRNNLTYNNAETSFTEGVPDFYTPGKFLRRMNHFVQTLDDWTGGNQYQQADYSGIHVSAGSNSRLTWQLVDYVATSQYPAVSTASTACTWDIIFRFSNMMMLTAEGDLVVMGGNYSAMEKAQLLGM